MKIMYFFFIFIKKKIKSIREKKIALLEKLMALNQENCKIKKKNLKQLTNQM